MAEIGGQKEALTSRVVRFNDQITHLVKKVSKTHLSSGTKLLHVFKVHLYWSESEHVSDIAWNGFIDFPVGFTSGSNKNQSFAPI